MSAALDTVVSFEIKPLSVRGKIVRLGPVIDDILKRHDYPPSVSALLAEAVALTAMLGTSLKFQGKFILQSKTDGPVDMIVADFISPNGIRGYARFNAEKLAALPANPSQAELLGKGYLAMTVDQGADMERYQGIVPLDRASLTEAADHYFAQSEQIPTRIRLAAGPMLTKGASQESWQAGAIMAQHLPSMGGVEKEKNEAEAAEEEAAPEIDDSWTRAKVLLDTVEDHELLDPTLPTTEVLYRLYHEDGVTVYPPLVLERHCTCSRPGVATMLEGFSAEDRAAMVKDGVIEVVCEFCSTHYNFAPAEIDAALAAKEAAAGADVKANADSV